jgi:hypothetical protein
MLSAIDGGPLDEKEATKGALMFLVFVFSIAA